MKFWIGIIVLIIEVIYLLTDLWPVIPIRRWYQLLMGLCFATVLMLIQYAALVYWFTVYTVPLPLELLAMPPAAILYGTICLALGLLLRKLIVRSLHQGATWLKHRAIRQEQVHVKS